MHCDSIAPRGAFCKTVLLHKATTCLYIFIINLHVHEYNSMCLVFKGSTVPLFLMIVWSQKNVLLHRIMMACQSNVGSTDRSILQCILCLRAYHIDCDSK